jgi:hypothetical protein
MLVVQGNMMLMGLGKVILVDLVRMLMVEMMWVGLFFKVLGVWECWLSFSSSFSLVFLLLNLKVLALPLIENIFPPHSFSMCMRSYESKYIPLPWDPMDVAQTSSDAFIKRLWASLIPHPMQRVLESSI